MDRIEVFKQGEVGLEAWVGEAAIDVTIGDAVRPVFIDGELDHFLLIEKQWIGRRVWDAVWGK